ncbi:MAG: glycosyl transferase, group 1 [Phycisphaerales bacterium]|nr:glycosyl transferase, group 1 [Phycisphaerales bacterium]
MSQSPVPGIAFVANSLPPYRVHAHARVAREMAGLRVWTLLTHDAGPWEDPRAGLIGRVDFGPGETTDRQTAPSRALHEWRKGGRVIRWIRTHEVRAVVLLGYNDVGRVRILRWCRRVGLPCFVWGDSNVLGDAARGSRRVVKQALVPRLLRLASGVLCCGRLGEAYFRRYGVPADRIFLFTNEPDYDLIRHLPADRVAAVAGRFGLRPGRRRIVFSGRLVPAKRPDLLLAAFAAIADRRPDWDVVLVGDGPLRAELEAGVGPGLRHRITFAGFVANQADVSAVYRASDVLALPSDHEPWALVVNEAVAAGLAVVSSTVVGAAAELVVDRVNGRLFPPGDLPALTECLLDVTQTDRTAGYRAAAPAVLADWRARGDLVNGLAKALGSVGVPTSRS